MIQSRPPGKMIYTPSTFARGIPPRITWDHEQEGHAFPAFFRRIALPDWPGHAIRRPTFIGEASRATAREQDGLTLQWPARRATIGAICSALAMGVVI